MSLFYLKFQEKIVSFESINLDLNKSIEKSKSTSSFGLDEMKNKYENEKDDLIRANNENYEKLLKEQLRVQGELKLRAKLF